MGNFLKKVGRFFHRSKVVACLILIPLFLSCILVVWFSEQLESSGDLKDLQEGTIMPRTVYAECDFKTLDPKELEQAREREAFKIPLYYRIDADRTDAIADKFKGFFRKIPSTDPDVSRYIDKGKREKTISDIIDCVLRKGVLAEERESDLSAWYTQETLKLLPSLGDARRRREIRVCDMVGGTFREFGAPLSVQDAAEQAASIFVPDRKIPDENQRGRVYAALAGIFKGYFAGGNLTADTEKTAKDAEEALSKIREDDLRYEKVFRFGDRIAEKNQKLTSCEKAYLNAYCRQLDENGTGRLAFRRFIKISLCMLLICFTVLYIRHIRPEVLRDNKTLLVLGCITIVSLLANWSFSVVFRYFVRENDISPQLLFLALPLSLPAVLTSAIYGLRAAVYLGLFISGIAAIVFDNSFAVLVSGILAGSVAGFEVYGVSDYKRFFGQAFFATILTEALAGFIFICQGFRPDYMDLALLRNAVCLCVFSGLFTTLAALVILFILESVFGVSTNMKYLTFIDRNHRLLKKLQLRAPGTYSHSSDVAFIAESAANAVGANSLRLQACALFHDVGKLEAPANFTENNPPENPHEKLSPKESAEKIRRHVSDGIALARQYALDGAIQEAIEQHHGTDFIGSFYMKAKQMNPDNPPDEADFRYAGPLPQNRENVILCLADCAEAISRGLPKAGDGKESYEEMLGRKMDEVILAKLKNGQFNESDMTLRELRLVRDSLVSSLVGLHHVRKAAYPAPAGEKESRI